MTFAGLATAVVAGGAAREARGQCDARQEWFGPRIGSFYGAAVAGAGDLDGDGWGDVLVGAWNDPGRSFFAATGWAFAYSGRDGAVLYESPGENPLDEYGFAIDGAGDVNEDGAPDFLIGAPGHPAGAHTGRVYLVSGLDGEFLRTFDGEAAGDRFGSDVANAGDLNGDGVNDAIVGAWKAKTASGEPAGGKAYVFSGADGALLRSWQGAAALDSLGYAVDGAGDLDGDGLGDLIVGAPGVNFDAGMVRIFSSADGQAILALEGEEPQDLFGWSAANAGDVNGDGVNDVAVGAPQAHANGEFYSGKGYVFSGADGSRLMGFGGTTNAEHYGHAVDGLGDFDGDGRGDMAFGALFGSAGGGPEAGKIEIRSGANGALLCMATQDKEADLLGTAVASAGDVNGDGLGDLIGGAPGDDGGLSESGGAFLYLGACDEFTLAVDPLVAGRRAIMRLACAAPGERVHVAYSLRGLGSTFVPQLDVTLDLAQPALAGSGRADAEGVVVVESDSRLPGSASGRRVWLQGAQTGHTTGVVEALVE